MATTDRLDTLDQFGSRKAVIPAEVTGRLRTWRQRVHAVLLVIFLSLPWIRINEMQAVLLDIPGRRFEAFGVLFLSHDAPLIFFILMFLVVALALATALWGRVWCGWACPQTVFIDSVYRRIEIWTEGNYIERRKLQDMPLNFVKVRKRALKWLSYLGVSSLIAHSFIAYFVGGPQLLAMIQGSPSENWTYFLIVLSVTALLLFNFGWFREQFCLIMCPYGRFQSVLMDQHTVAIMYDERRGEPRKGAPATQRRGNCVSCNRCVQVCPTGIDIRNGIQMECISCTACIDACNAIMSKVNKPAGLIRHQRISGAHVSLWRPRVVVYLVLAAMLILGLVFSVSAREPYSLAILRAKDMPYQILQDGKVLNHFKVHLMNQSRVAQQFELAVHPEDIDRGVRLTQSKSTHAVNAGGSMEAHFFILFPKDLLTAKGELKLKIQVREQSSRKVQDLEVVAVGPYSSGS